MGFSPTRTIEAIRFPSEESLAVDMSFARAKRWTSKENVFSARLALSRSRAGG